MIALKTIGYAIGIAACAFGLLVAYAGWNSDVGSAEKMRFVWQGLSISLAGLLGIGVITWVSRRTQ